MIGTTHDRNINAAMNLKGLATPTALSVATASGQEEIGVDYCAPIL